MSAPGEATTADGPRPAPGPPAPTTGPPTAAVPPARRASYGVGAIGTGMFSTAPGLLLLFYLTDVLGVGAALAGVLLVVPKAWDVVLAPLVGTWSDRTAAARGTRAPWLLAGAVLLPVGLAAMFLSPFDGTAGGLWVAGCFLLAASAFAVFQVPWSVLPAEMTDDPAERTAVTTWRIVFLAVGILLAGGLGPVLAGGDEPTRGGYAVMGLVLGAITALALLTAARGTRWVRSRPGPAGGLRAALRTPAARGPFRLLLGAYVLQSLAVAVLLAGAPYVATYRLEDPAAVSLLFVALVAPALLVGPLWRRWADRAGKAPVLLVATAGFTVLALGLVPAAAAGATGAVIGLSAALGVGYAALQLLPYSLLPDLAAEADAGDGGRAAGALTGLWSAGETAGAALGPGLFALVLALGGFRSAPADERVAQPDAALQAILLGWALLPAALLALSLPLLVALARRRRRDVPA